MPPRKTRQLYVNYHTARRGGTPAARRLVEREWTAKTAEHRHEWVAMFQNVQVAIQKANAQRDRADDSEIAVSQANGHVEGIANPRPGDFQRLLDALDVAIAHWSRLRPLYVDLRLAWENVCLLESHYQAQNVNTINHYLHEAERVGWQIRHVDDKNQEFNEERDNPPVVANAAGRQRIPFHNVRQTRRDVGRSEMLNGIDRAGPIGLFPPGQYGWVPYARLPMGMSSGYLWLQFDDHDQIVDRVVCKHLFLQEYSWFDAREWQDGDIKKLPLEIACHQAMDGIYDVRNLVRLRRAAGDLVDRARMSYRIYLAWAEHQDLQALIEERRSTNDEVPEPFIWYVAECLVDCAFAMYQGGGTSTTPGWEQIVHRDLKPANIFLDQPEPANINRYPFYPKPLVGDFGLAFRTSFRPAAGNVPAQDDPNNPWWYNTDAGTEGFMAPEQKRWVDPDTVEPVDDVPLSAWSNIYGIGMILRCMVTLNQRPEQPLWLGRAQSDHTLQLRDNEWPVDRYSRRLKNMIGRCLDHNVYNRPTLQWLRNEINMATAQPSDLARGMRSDNAPADVQDEAAVRCPDNTYAIGLARHDLPLVE